MARKSVVVHGRRRRFRASPPDRLRCPGTFPTASVPFRNLVRRLNEQPSCASPRGAGWPPMLIWTSLGQRSGYPPSVVGTRACLRGRAGVWLPAQGRAAPGVAAGDPHRGAWGGVAAPEHRAQAAGGAQPVTGTAAGRGGRLPGDERPRRHGPHSRAVLPVWWQCGRRAFPPLQWPARRSRLRRPVVESLDETPGTRGGVGLAATRSALRGCRTSAAQRAGDGKG